MITPKLYEFILIMPDFVFHLLFSLLGLNPNQHVISPGQADLLEGRKTQTRQNLHEMVEVTLLLPLCLILPFF